MPKSTLKISLPPGFTSPDDYHASLADFLSLDSGLPRKLTLSPESHPNRIAITGVTTEVHGNDMVDWWAWAESVPVDEREKMLDELASGKIDTQNEDLPKSLSQFIRQLEALKLPRVARHGPAERLHRTPQHQSPKKAHEVSRMALAASEVLIDKEKVKKVVDIGAGMGYLSHTLSSSPYDLDVLALDHEDYQTQGALSISSKSTPAPPFSSGSICHKTAKIESFDSLSNAIDDWLAPSPSDNTEIHTNQLPDEVLILGLHACGSLTVDIIKSFVQASTSHSKATKWTPAGLVVVGCCYNLMTLNTILPVVHPSSTFEKSRLSTSKETAVAIASFPLTPTLSSLRLKKIITLDHLQLATSSPEHWAVTQKCPILSINKIVYRARLDRWIYLRTGIDLETDSESGGLRLGRMPERASQGSFVVYLKEVKKRLLEAGKEERKEIIDLFHNLDEAATETELLDADGEDLVHFRLQLLHVLRSLLGPVIEAFILVDRCLFLRDSLVSSQADGQKEYGRDNRMWTIELVPLFDMATGSLRNCAIYVQ